MRHRAAIFVALCLTAMAGCASLHSSPPPKLDPPVAVSPIAPAWPGKVSLRVSQYVFFADFELNRDDPLFKELAEMRDQVVRDLQLPTADSAIQVYLFEDRERYERFMQARYPDLPRRRAFFVAQPRTVGGTDELLVFTFWGDKVRQDLRHELTHALLHSVLRDVPLWLDEGIAEFFELPPEADGVNAQHLDELRKISFTPDLPRLEQMTQVSQMTPAEYREAWAWVHLMLRGSPPARAALLAYLQQLRSTPNPGPLNARLIATIPQPGEALSAHLRQLLRAQAAGN